MKKVIVESLSDALLIKGALTCDTAMGALEQIKKGMKKPSAICLDFGGVTKSDSSALALVTELLRFAKLKNKSIKIRNMPKKLIDLARVSGLDSLLPIQE